MSIIHRLVRCARPLFVLAFLLAASATFGQNTSIKSVVNYVDFAEGGTAGSPQNLDVYFTLLTQDGQVITDTMPDDAYLLLNDGRRIDEVSLDRPHNPIFVALVFDASGSMRDAIDEMRQAAIDAVNNAPPEAAFGVYQFNEPDTEGGPVLRTLQGFVADRSLIFAAINNLDIQNRGTCLYDATFEALNTVKLVPPSSRRAILLFTDGRDEKVAGGELDPCSKHQLSDVITAATAPGQQTPIYAIGLQGNSPVATRELEDIAGSSGGLARFGDLAALPGLFQEIMRALGSQIIASAQVCVPRGPSAASLYLTMERGLLDPIGVRFEAQGGCVEPTDTPTPTNTPSPTPTITPRPLALVVETFAYEQTSELATFIIARSGDGDVATYRILIDDAQSGTNLVSFDVDADPTSGERQLISFQTTNLPNASLDISVIALDSAGNTMARSQARRAAIIRPSATPSATPTPSPTLAPVDVQVDNIRYDEASDTVSLDLTLAQQQRIEDFQVSVIVDSTNQTVGTFNPPLANTVDLNFGGFRPNIDYRIRVLARTTEGVSLSREVKFFYEKPPTPTPVPTDTMTFTPSPVPTNTPTPTATLVPVAVEITGLTPAPDWTTIAVQLRLQGQDRIVDDFEIRLIDKSGFSVATLSQPVADQFFIPLDRLTPGQEYRLVIVAPVLNEAPARAEATFTYTPPQTPSATPSTTPSPEPTATPTAIPGASVTGVHLSGDNTELTLDISASNTPMIDSYRVQIISKDGLVVSTITSKAPPYDSLTLPITSLAPGEYTIELDILDANGIMLNKSSVPIGYNPPPTATPTAEPSAVSVFIQNVSTTARTNPVVLVAIGALFLVLLIILIWAIRRLTRRGGSVYNTGMIDDQPTTPFHAPDLSNLEGLGGVGNAEDEGDASGTMDRTRPPADDQTKVDMDKTKVEFSPFAGAGGLPPNLNARLVILSSDDQSMLNREVVIDAVKFRIGRQYGNLVFRRDDYVSREHAEIVYENGTFYVSDLGSAGGTSVDNDRIPAGDRVALKNGMVISLGTRTKLRFVLE